MAYHVFLMFLEFYGPSWCLSPADRGLCQANESRFYYNSIIGKCRPFKYSGCGGNENNFTSKKACLKTCKKGIEDILPINSLVFKIIIILKLWMNFNLWKYEMSSICDKKQYYYLRCLLFNYILIILPDMLTVTPFNVSS